MKIHQIMTIFFILLVVNSVSISFAGDSNNKSDKIIILVCNISSGRYSSEGNFIVDLSSSTVNGYRAKIDDGEIVYNTEDSEIRINRYTGSFFAVGESAQASGTCRLASEKKF